MDQTRGDRPRRTRRPGRCGPRRLPLGKPPPTSTTATPRAAKAGAFSAQRTAAAVEQVKQAITVTALDPATPVNHQTDNDPSLFAPDATASMRPDLTSPDANRAAEYVVFPGSEVHVGPVARESRRTTPTPSYCGAAEKAYLAPQFSDHDYPAPTTSIAPGMSDPNQPPPTGPGNRE